jgi:hypothetical protein
MFKGLLVSVSAFRLVTGTHFGEDGIEISKGTKEQEQTGQNLGFAKLYMDTPQSQRAIHKRWTLARGMEFMTALFPAMENGEISIVTEEASLSRNT